jgi:hypothetical protein
LVVALILAASCLPAWAGDEPPARLLWVAWNEDEVVASNVLFGRSDGFSLKAQERKVREISDNAVYVLETNRRLIAYSVYTASWVTISLRAGEVVDRLEAEDFSAFALTNRRILNFNGRSAVWSQSGL